MSFRLLWYPVFATLLLSLTASFTLAAESEKSTENTPVMQQTMDSIGVWQSVHGSKPLTAEPDGVASSPVMELKNGVVAAALNRAIPADVDWTLRFEVLHTKFKRGGWIGLFNQARLNGYAVSIGSGTEKSFKGMGLLRLHRVVRDKPFSDWQDAWKIDGNLLDGPVSTDHNPDDGTPGDGALSPPMMQIELQYNAETHQLTLHCDGKVAARVQAPALPKDPALMQVVMCGNTSMYFDNVEVTAALPPLAEGEQPKAFLTVNVKDFGAVGDGQHDDSPAFRAALEKLSTVMGPKVLKVPAGEYRLAPAEGTPNQQGHVNINNFHDLTLEGEPGVLLVMTSPFHQGVRVSGGSNVRLKSIAVDYQPLPYTQGTIVEATPDNSSFVVALDEGYPRTTDPHISAEKTKNVAYLYRPDTTLKLNEYYDQYIENIEPLSDDRVRLTSRNPVVPEFVGQKVAMVARRKAVAVLFVGATESFAEDVTVYAAPGLAFGLRGTNHITLDHCTITQRPGTNRLMSSNADGIHVKWGKRGPTIVNCWLEGMGDDSVNIGGTYQTIHAQPDARTLIVDNHGSLRDAGDNIRLVHNQTGQMQRLSPCIDVQSTQWNGESAMKLTFADDLPTIEHTLDTAPRIDADMIINFDEVATSPVIRNNFFGRHRVRGILMRAPGAIIENNRFEDLLGPGVKLGHHYNGRIEGPNGSHTVIRGNTFINIRRSNIQLSDAGLKGGADQPQRSIEDVQIIDNRFSLYGQPSAHGGAEPGNVIWIDNAHNVLLSDNYIDIAHPDAVEAPIVVVNQADDVTIRDTVVQGHKEDPSAWLVITDLADKDTIRVEQ